MSWDSSHQLSTPSNLTPTHQNSHPKAAGIRPESPENESSPSTLHNLVFRPINKAMKEERAEKEEPILLESPAGESDLRRLIDLISSLISLSHSVKTFPAKWQSIRAKLEQLNSSLLSAENCSSSENSLFSGTVESICSTAIKCQNLARCCINLSYSGKLLMQSDLDAILANFDRHLYDLARIYNTGILKNSCAIVVSRPPPGAGIDDMRFYLRDLFTRLRIGDCKMKLRALIALNECLLEDDKNVRIVVETGDMVGLLVDFLEYVEVDTQEESAKAISVIAGFNSYKGILVSASAIAPLIRVLEVGSDLGKESAARALHELTENSDNVWSVSAHGGVTVLLKICSECRGSQQLISSACCILRNLSGVDEIKRFMIEEGAISTFIMLIGSKDDVLQIHGMELLQTMSSGDEPVRQMVIREGGIRRLIRVLDPKSSYSSKTREVSLRVISNLSLASNSSINVLLGSEFLNWVLFFMQNGDISLQESAAKTTFRLCGMSEETKKAMGDAGFLPELVKLLDAKSSDIQEQAGEALLNMISTPKNRKRFVQHDLNVLRLLQLLNPEDEKSGNRKLLLATLLSLTHSNTARRKIANSGYIKHLEKLAEDGNTEAKRIIKKLSENRFRSIFGAIWHA